MKTLRLAWACLTLFPKWLADAAADWVERITRPPR